MKVSVEGGRPEGVWVSWNEPCGVGDGSRTEFPLPFPAAEARGLLVMSDYGTVEPDGRFRETDIEGKILRDEPDGWTIAAGNDPTAEPGKIVFQRPRRVGARVSVSALDRKVGDAFKILATDSLLTKKLDELMPKEMKGRKRNEVPTLPPVQDYCRLAFTELVTNWSGITDGAGAPLPCTAANKKTLLDRTDAIAFGMFVLERSRTIQRERLAGFEASVQD
jgi:hypothetical protein